MNKLFSYLFIGMLLSVSIAAALFLSNYQEPTTVRTSAQQATPTTTVLAKNLEVPWALGFLPDGNILFTERTGKVKLLNPATSAVTTITTIPGVKAANESGLLGLAIHPQFTTNNFVYLYYSYDAGGIKNRVARYTFTNNQLTNATTLIDAIPGNNYHNGGRLRFGPDGYLYITTGDAGNESSAQDTNSLAGKILRVTDAGAAAPGNPLNNRVWSYGHRNPQGLAWNGTTMYATEHGPSQPSCCDELNRIEAGKNYGWPDVKADETKAGTIKNLMHSGNDGGTTWAPSGTTFYNGSVFFAALKGQGLYEATVNGDSATIKKQHFKNQLGRIRDVVIGPDNMLYIATSNRSAQGGSAQPEDDKIIKVAFAGVGGVAPTIIAATTIPAPTNIVPTFGCVSNEPCTTAAPTSTGATPPVGGQNPGTGTPPAGAITPQPGNPGTNPQPCPTNGISGVFTNSKKKVKSGGGFIEQFIKFILRLLELFFKLLGIAIPNPGQIPQPNPGQNPDPGTDPQPCPEPTNDPAPTSPAEPTQSADPTTVAPTTAPTTQVQPPITTPPATSTVPVGSKVVFLGNYDTGDFSQWEACQLKGVQIAKGSCATTGNYSAAIVNDGAEHPTAMRYELRANEAGNGKRAEVLQDEAASVVEGDERWYEWSMKFDQSFQNPNGRWFIVMQWHSGDDSPPLAINVSNSGNVEIGGDGVSTPKKTIGPVRKGQWVKYVLHVKFSRNASTGYVEAWENGVKTVQKYNRPTMSSGENYLKQGIYRDTSNKSTSILYHDDLRVTAP